MTVEWECFVEGQVWRGAVALRVAWFMISADGLRLWGLDDQGVGGFGRC